ncbi:hypothetical protein LINGRAHAP2_LOCUS36375, partial [Linum grandiflorum]
QLDCILSWNRRSGSLHLHNQKCLRLHGATLRHVDLHPLPPNLFFSYAPSFFTIHGPKMKLSETAMTVLFLLSSLLVELLTNRIDSNLVWLEFGS